MCGALDDCNIRVGCDSNVSKKCFHSFSQAFQKLRKFSRTMQKVTVIHANVPNFLTTLPNTYQIFRFTKYLETCSILYKSHRVAGHILHCFRKFSLLITITTGLTGMYMTTGENRIAYKALQETATTTGPHKCEINIRQQVSAWIKKNFF